MNIKPKRRLFRFSLRTLLLFVTIASVGFGWLGVKMRQAQRQRVAVEAIEELGGLVLYDDQYDPPGPNWLTRVLGTDIFEKANYVSWSGPSLTDAELVHLRELTGLRMLFISYANVTDAGLAHLEELTQLKYLQFADTKLTDMGLQHLHGLSQLEVLRLEDTHVTDKGCHELQKVLPNLKIERVN